MSTGSNVNSAVSFYSRQRHKRGKSKLVSRPDLYLRAMESESYLPMEKYGIELTRRANGVVDVHYGYTGDTEDFSKHSVVDDILPEDAADAVSQNWCIYANYAFYL